MTTETAKSDAQKELMAALQNWYDKIGKKRAGTFKAYENRLDEAYTEFLKVKNVK